MEQRISNGQPNGNHNVYRDREFSFRLYQYCLSDSDSKFIGNHYCQRFSGIHLQWSYFNSDRNGRNHIQLEPGWTYRYLCCCEPNNDNNLFCHRNNRIGMLRDNHRYRNSQPVANGHCHGSITQYLHWVFNYPDRKRCEHL